jgi:hypothetical protein
MILIMAHGRGSRWVAGTFRDGWNPPCLFKQFVKIGEYPNITRTLNMLHNLKQTDILVIAPGEFLPYVEDYAQMASLREQLGHLHQGITETYQYWKDADRLLFIYGDVVYEWSALERMLFDKLHRVSFFGRRGSNIYTGKDANEIFSIGVPKTHRDEFYNKIRKGWNERRPRIWGYTYTDDTADFIELDTWSDDVDSPEEYRQFFSKLKELALADDERR